MLTLPSLDKENLCNDKGASKLVFGKTNQYIEHSHWRVQQPYSMHIYWTKESFRLMQGNPDPGIQEIYACGIRNAGFWNPEYSSSNSESRKRLGTGM